MALKVVLPLALLSAVGYLPRPVAAQSSASTSAVISVELTGSIDEPQDPPGPAVITEQPPPPPSPPSPGTTDADAPGGQPAQEAPPAKVAPAPRIPVPMFPVQGTVFHQCGCANSKYDFKPKRNQYLRHLSNRFLKDTGALAPQGWSNFLWSWGQWVDHTLVATSDLTDGEEYSIFMRRGRRSAKMTLHRVEAEPAEDGVCRNPFNRLKPVMDGSQVYGTVPEYLKDVMREQTGCRLVTSPGNLLPVTTDEVDGKNLFVAGDGRVGEHSILTGMHTVWMREHNRLCDEIEASAEYNKLDDDEKFDLARKVVTAKMQHITLNHWLPHLGIKADDVRKWKSANTKPDISAEFFIAFRFGHDLIPDHIGDYTVKDIFSGERFFGITGNGGSKDPEAANARLNDLFSQVASSKAGALDGHASNALRDFLFGTFGQDLLTRNMFRSMETGLSTYSELAKCYGVEPVGEVLKIMRFKPRDVPVLGLLKENEAVDDVFGPVNKAIMTDQFHRSFFGQGALWWEDGKAALGSYAKEVEACTLGKVISANLGITLHADVFIA